MPTSSNKLFQSRRLHLGLLTLVLLTSLGQRAEYLNQEPIGRHVWRQSQTMWNVRNFVRHDFNILNPRNPVLNGDGNNIQRLEFPIYQWAVAAIQKVTGEHIIVARLLAFACGAAAVFALFFLVGLLTNNWLASLLAGGLLTYSPTFYYHSISPMPDTLALAAATWYVYFIIKHQRTRTQRDLLWAGGMLCLATAAKLPFLMVSIISISLFFVDLFRTRLKDWQPLKDALIQLAIITPALAWYAWVIGDWVGNPILDGGAEAPWSEYERLLTFHQDHMFPYFLTIPPMWVPIWVGLGTAVYRFRKVGWAFGLITITFVYFWLEILPININHDYYLYPLLIWMYLLAGLGADSLSKIPYVKYLLPALIIWAGFYTDSRTNRWWLPEVSYFDMDVLTNADELRDAVPAGEEVIILNDPTTFIFAYKVDKLAHIFNNDDLPIEWVHGMVENLGVNYLYSNSPTYNAKPELQPYLDDLILKRGNVSVYKLKLPQSQTPEGS